MKLVRNFNKLLVYNKTPERVDQYIADMSQEVGVKFVKMTDAEKVVHGSDVVITTTPAKTLSFGPTGCIPGCTTRWRLG